MTTRFLIVNADDFGQSAGVNRGIVEAHERGVVTSASLMVRWPAAAEAAAYGRNRPRLSVGLHVDLCEWIFRNGQWEPLYEVVPFADAAAVRAEILKQLATFESLMGAPPTHIDSHQHAHLREPARAVAIEAAARLGVPLRSCDARVRYCGKFYGQDDTGAPFPQLIAAEALAELVRGLPEGTTELGCHPGLGTDVATMYSKERELELAALCDPVVRAALAEEKVALRSFRDVREGAAWRES